LKAAGVSDAGVVAQLLEPLPVEWRVVAEVAWAEGRYALFTVGGALGLARALIEVTVRDVTTISPAPRLPAPR